MTDSIIFSIKSNIKATKMAIVFMAFIFIASVTGCSKDMSSISENVISENAVSENESLIEEKTAEESSCEASREEENVIEKDEDETVSADQILEETEEKTTEEVDEENIQDENIEEVTEAETVETEVDGEVSTTESAKVTEEVLVVETQPVVTTSTTVTATGMTETMARDKVNTFLTSVYPEGTTWGWENSYTAYNGKQYWACDGFAYMLSDYIFGNAPYTSIPVDLYSIRIGDILTTTVNNGHRCVVIGVDMATGYIFTADGNCEGKVTYKIHYDISQITGVVTRYSDTSWKRGQSAPVKMVYGWGQISNSFGYDFRLCYYIYYQNWNQICDDTITFYYADGSLDGYYEADGGSEYYNNITANLDNQWYIDNSYFIDYYTNACERFYPEDYVPIDYSEFFTPELEEEIQKYR